MKKKGYNEDNVKKIMRFYEAKINGKQMPYKHC